MCVDWAVNIAAVTLSVAWAVNIVGVTMCVDWAVNILCCFPVFSLEKVNSLDVRPLVLPLEVTSLENIHISAVNVSRGN